VQQILLHKKHLAIKLSLLKRNKVNIMAMKKASSKKMMAKPAKAAPKAAGMTAAQKKLPAFIQKSIMAKNKAKKK
jgi:hypothetical protein